MIYSSCDSIIFIIIMVEFSAIPKYLFNGGHKNMFVKCDDLKLQTSSYPNNNTSCRHVLAK